MARGWPGMLDVYLYEIIQPREKYISSTRAGFGLL
ncbi:hypothetical protein PANA5342_4324 [Pantoea ananatis LMG 5342]|nr:hypothetical protein PANA5342_4324 [Pantoea ananatis LMG 5342]